MSERDWVAGQFSSMLVTRHHPPVTREHTARWPEGKVPTVHLLVGVPGSGKTTLAKALAAERRAVRFTLDEWMLRLHGLRYDDPNYGSKADGCRELIWDTAQEVLRSGADVILDWSQWNRYKRSEWIQRVQAAGWRAVVQFLDVSVDVAIAQVEARSDAHSHSIDESGVRHMIGLLEPPTDDEGVEVIRHARR